MHLRRPQPRRRTGAGGGRWPRLALRRIGLRETATQILDPLVARLRQALGYLQRVPGDLGKVYELVYEFIRKGGRLPVYARWIEGEGTRA